MVPPLTDTSVEKPKEEATILVIAPADLHQGFQFVATYEGGAFLVTVPHPVKKGESFEVPHPDTQKNLQLTNNPNHGVNDGVTGRFACCCNAAPCCFPDGCCPDGCCPDGCCPNGNCGEQFEGCCFHYDFRQSNAIQAKLDLMMNGHSYVAPSFGLRQLLQGLVDSSASPNLVVAGAQGAVANAKKQHEENEKKNQHGNNNMANQSEQNRNKFKQNMSEVEQIHKAVQSGTISKEVADMKVRKIFGLSTDRIAEKGTIYPLGGCCNYAPCLFPDGCCPDGCCPDGCCPNGYVGEQFKGCCMSIKGRMPWNAPAASSAYQSSAGSINNTFAFIAMVEAIVSDTNDATDEEKFDALKGLLDATDKITKEQEVGNDAMATGRTSLLGELSADAKGDYGSSESMKGFCTIS